MTKTRKTSPNPDFAGDRLYELYNEFIDQRLLNEWQLEDEQIEHSNQYARHCLLLANKRTLAVTMDWIHQMATQAFSYITKLEGDKFVRNLYMVRAAVDDLFVGAAYHELSIGDLYGPDALVDVLSMVKEQVDREVLGAITKHCTYNLADARKHMDSLWYFMSCGMIGTRTNDLAYGNDVLVLKGVHQHPRTLVNTGEIAAETIFAKAVDTLNALL